MRLWTLWNMSRTDNDSNIPVLAEAMAPSFIEHSDTDYILYPPLPLISYIYPLIAACISVRVNIVCSESRTMSHV